MWFAISCVRIDYDEVFLALKPFLSFAVFLLAGFIWSTPLAAKEKQPNIILMLIDDLGYGDIGAFGCPDIPTPNIDRIVNQGVKCRYAYTPSPICMPSRAGIMMGMYPQRFGVHGLDDRGDSIPKDHPTLAEMLRQVGYHTGMVGRWDMGSFEQGPLDRGFMEVARRSFLAKDHPLQKLSDYKTTYYQQDAVYWTERQAKEMVEFVSKRAEQPFFLYFAPLAVHQPAEEVPREYIEGLDHIPSMKRRYLAGTLVALDQAIGKLLDALEKEGLDQNTLIIFTSDNGGNSTKDDARNYPGKGGKATEWDGGCRVPTAFCWKGTLPAGKTYDGLISLLDIYATAAAVSGAQLPKDADGVNLMPYLTGKKEGPPHQALFFSWIEREGPKFAGIRVRVEAVRSDRWRLLKTKDQPHWRLYDIWKDPVEEHNVASLHPQIVQKLAAEFERWSQANLPPSGPRSRQGRVPRGIGWATPESPGELKD